jgi:hypothetical protein
MTGPYQGRIGRLAGGGVRRRIAPATGLDGGACGEHAIDSCPAC